MATQRSRSKASSDICCTCSQCSKSTTTDRTTLRQRQGRYIDISEERRHRSDDLRRSSLRVGASSDGVSTGQDALSLPAILLVQPTRTTALHQIAPSLVADTAQSSASNNSANTKLHSTEVGSTSPDLTLHAHLSKLVAVLDVTDGVSRGMRNLYERRSRHPLIFTQTALPHGTPITELPKELNLQARENKHFLQHQAAVIANLSSLRNMISSTLAVGISEDLRGKFEETEKFLANELQQLESFKLGEWQRNVGHKVLTDPYTSNPISEMDPIALMMHLLPSILHVLCGVSLDHTNLALNIVKQVVNAVGDRLSASEYQKQVLATSVPQDVRTCLSHLNLDPDYESLVSCPKCCYIYPHTYDESGLPQWPQKCTYKETADAQECNRNLWKGIRTIKTTRPVFLDAPPPSDYRFGPTREFVRQKFKSWIARLYWIPGLEEILDRHLSINESPDGEMHNIWDATLLRNFPKIDNKPYGAGRLLFAFNYDGLNPLGNKEAGKQVSIGAMYAVCLNLPRALRFKEEYIFNVGVIPGPKEPTLDQMNQFLRGTVDEWVEFWQEGYHLSRTPRYKDGRTVKGGVAQTVDDLPATDSVTGYSYRSSHPCHECWITADKLNDGVLGRRRVHSEDAMHGRHYRDAQTADERTRIWNEHHIRYSEFDRLPYWDRTACVAIDSMHMISRLLQRHIREIWGMNIKSTDGPGKSFDEIKGVSSAEVTKAHGRLMQDSREALKGFKAPVLKQLCRDLDLPFNQTKQESLKLLLKYRQERGWFDKNDKPIPGAVSLKDIPIHTPDQPNPNSPEILYHTASKSKLNRLKKVVLASLAVQVLLRTKAGGQQSLLDKKKRPFTLTSSDPNAAADELHQRLNKSGMLKIISDARKQDDMLDEDGVLIQHDEDTANGKNTRVLGRATLKEIEAEMDRMIGPNSLTSPPRHPGQKKWGKFTADQWVVFSSHVLAGALIRLWGSKSAESWEFRFLKNFLHLIHAIDVANGLRASEDTAAEFDLHIQAYIQGLRQLYPGTSITIYQHLALHFADQLRRFGPVHAWRCFPYERFNGLMQKINTNFHFGQLEKTLFVRFCQMQNLKVILHTAAISKNTHLYAVWDRYCKVFHSNVRGTLRGDDKALNSASTAIPYDELFTPQLEAYNWESRQEDRLTNQEYVLLQSYYNDDGHSVVSGPISSKAFVRSKVEKLGHSYQAFSEHPGNSQVIFRKDGGQTSAGIIQKVFSHSQPGKGSAPIRAETFLSVIELLPLTGRDKVMYSIPVDISFFRACHMYDKLDPKRLRVISVHDAIGCFTRCSRDWANTDFPVSYLRLIRKGSINSDLDRNARL